MSYCLFEAFKKSPFFADRSGARLTSREIQSTLVRWLSAEHITWLALLIFNDWPKQHRVWTKTVAEALNSGSLLYLFLVVTWI